MNDNWNLADVWETIADVVGDAPAVVCGDLVRSWSEFEHRASQLAGVFAAHSIGHQSKVAHYLYNRPEYLEATFASFKQRAVPVNVNYRYTDAELSYLFTNSDAEAIIVDAGFLDHVVRLLPQLPLIKLVVVVGGAGTDSEPLPSVPGVSVLEYEAALAESTPAPRIERSLDDLWFLYTGGTTGMPKGVMWPHRSLLGTGRPTFKTFGADVPESLAEVAVIARRVHHEAEPIRLIPAAPLMHGTSAISSWGVLNAAGAIVLLESRSLDAAELLSVVERRRVTNLTIVGDAFAKPILAELRRAEEAEEAGTGRRYDLSSLRLVISSGVMWSQPVKEALLERADLVLADLLGSSEGVGFANSVARRDRPAPTARFKLGQYARVFNEAGLEVEPGSGERGLLAVGGPIPMGYYNDETKSAETFREFGGRRWSVPGDWATVEVDGTITLLGRGSACINTAGEKVFPEEVEEALKTCPGVRDANVVGVADEKWGQAVCAVVSFDDGATVSADELAAHCRVTLAGYKCPKRFVMVDAVVRGPNGKADYRWAASVAEAAQ